MQKLIKTLEFCKIILGWINIALSLLIIVNPGFGIGILFYYFLLYSLLLLVVDFERVAIDFFRNLSKLVNWSTLFLLVEVSCI